MATYKTSDQLGRRPTASAVAPVQSYQGGIVEGAQIDAAQQIRQAGAGLERLGAGITAEEERRQKEAQAEQEKQNRINDSLLEAQMKSALMRASIQNTDSFNTRGDIENFLKEDSDSIDNISSGFLSKFSLPENQELMRLYVEDFKVKRQSDIGTVVRNKTIDRNNAIYDQAYNDNLVAYSRAGNDPVLQNELYNQTKKMTLTNHLQNNGSEQDYVAKVRSLEIAFGQAYLSSLSNEEKARALNSAFGRDSGVQPRTKNEIINFTINDLEGGDKIVQEPNGGIAKYGINSIANPDVDVANLTKSQAEKIYKEKYWDANNIDQYPPEIQPIVFDMYVNGFGDVKGAVKESGGDPAKLLELRQNYYDGLVRSNPEKYGQYASGWRNRLDKLSGSSQLQQTGTPLDRMPYDVLQNEMKKVRAEYKPELQLTINDAIAELSQTGATTVPIDNEQIAFVYGEDAGQVFDQIERAREFGQVFTTVKTTTPQEDMAILESSKPSGENYVNEQKRYEALTQIIAQKREALEKNPTDYVKKNYDDVARAFDSYAQLSDQINPDDPRTQDVANLALQDAVSLSLDKQEELGVPAGKRMAISGEDAASIVQQLGTIDPQQRVTYVEQLQSQYGEYWQDVYMDLVDAGLSDGMAEILAMNGVDQRKARAMLIEADAAGAELEKAIPNEIKKGLDTAIYDVSKDYFATISVQPENTGKINQSYNAIKKLALQYLYSGETNDPNKAAEKAYQEIVEKKYNIHGNLRIPRTYNDKIIMTALRDSVPNMIRENKNINPMIMGSYYNTPTSISTEQYLDDLADSAQFYLSPDEKHVYMLDAAGFTVVASNNGRIEPVAIPLGLLQRNGVSAYQSSLEIQELRERQSRSR